jgi:hypothetical protein
LEFHLLAHKDLEEKRVMGAEEAVGMVEQWDSTHEGRGQPDRLVIKSTEEAWSTLPSPGDIAGRDGSARGWSLFLVQKLIDYKNDQPTFIMKSIFYILLNAMSSPLNTPTIAFV